MRGFLLFVLMIVVTGCDGSSSNTEAEYVSSAQNYLDRGELNSAAIELKNVLTKNPENPEARLLLGKLYLDNGNGLGAVKELLRAREMGISDEAILPALARAYLKQQKHEETLGLLGGSSLSLKAQADLLTSHGLAYMMQGNIEKARRVLETALEKDPGSAYTLYGWAQLSTAASDEEAARQYLDKSLAANDRFAPSWALVGDLDRFDKKSEMAEEAYRKAIESTDDDASYRLKRAMLRMELKDYDDAQKDISLLKKKSPNQPGVNFAQGLLHLLSKRYPEAQESFELVLKVSPNYMPALYYLSVVQVAQGQQEQASKNLSQIVSEYPTYLPARELLAKEYLKQGNYEKVESLMRPVVTAESDDPTSLNLLATALLGQNKTEEAIQLYAKVAALEPGSAVTKVRLGMGQLLEGKQIDGMANLESAVELDPEFAKADIVLVLQYLQNKDFEKARQSAKAFIEKQPKNVAAYNLLGLAYMGLNKPEEAAEAYKTALKIAPGDPVASHNLAVFSLLNSRPEEARSYYQGVLKYHKDHLKTLIRLSLLEAKLGDTKSARAALEQAMAAYPDAVQPRVLMARQYLQAGKSEKAVVVLQEVQEKQPNNLLLLVTLGEMQLANRDFQSAKLTLKRVTELAPDSAHAHFLLAKAYASLGEQEKTEQALSRALELNPNHYAARLAMTRLQIQNGEIEASKKNLALLQKTAADNPDVRLIEAGLLIRSGNLEEAQIVLEKRFRDSPSTKSLLDLTRLYWSRGRRNEAVVGLEKWVEGHTDDVAAQLALADTYVELERRKEAIRQYETILKSSKNNLAALNNLAWLLIETDPDRALAYAEKARSLAPDSGVIMDTMAAALLQKGDLARARRMNERALQTKPESPTFLFRKAMIEQGSGNTDEAIKVLRLLLESRQAFPERAEAGLILKRLSGS
ncbi:MAG TPA: PEP-CTERM system TPR-repeat protein PrsT [Nitrospirae bacterium]|nr:PEP-CTERM system TPR-repeat protein PrsT [Nitrospirota bacterium]